MNAGRRIGRIAGIEIRVHWSIAMIVVLISWSMAAAVLPDRVPDRSALAYLIAGIAAAGGLVASILAHECAHALVANRHGVGVDRITLWLLGGVAELREQPRTARSELRIAAVGPLTSVALGIIALGAALIAHVADADLTATVVGWLAMLNLVLALFNLLPGAPLDGGRVLAAVLWERSGDERRSRWRAAGAGVAVGQLLALLGGAVIITTGALDGLWFVLIGWFIATSARGEQMAAQRGEVLAGVRVADIMTPSPQTARAEESVAAFADSELAGRRVSTFPLADRSNRIVGVVTLRQLRSVPPVRRATTTLLDAGTSLERTAMARPHEPIVDVLRRSASETGRILVVDADGDLIGIVTPSDVTAAFDRGVVSQPDDSWAARAS